MDLEEEKQDVVEIQIPGLSVILERLNRMEERQKEIQAMLEEKAPVKNWLTEEEAQTYTGYSRTQLYALRRAGKIQGKEGNGLNRYYRASLDKYMGRSA